MATRAYERETQKRVNGVFFLSKAHFQRLPALIQNARSDLWTLNLKFRHNHLKSMHISPVCIAVCTCQKPIEAKLIAFASKPVLQRSPSRKDGNRQAKFLRHGENAGHEMVWQEGYQVLAILLLVID